MPFNRKRQVPLAVLSALLILLILAYTARLYYIQVKKADEYSSVAGSTSTLTTVLKAPRGEIIDCNGRKIAVNRDGYNIVFNKAYVKDDLNDIILALVKSVSYSLQGRYRVFIINKTAMVAFIGGLFQKLVHCVS